MQHFVGKDNPVKKEDRYIKMMNKAMINMLWEGFKISIKNPGYALFVLKTIIAHKRAQKRRMAWDRQGIHVPPYMIVSITKRCNLNCKGCYARVHHRNVDAEMSEDTLRDLIAESKELGISFILLAGGEPLMRGDILEIVGDFPEILFPIFTNGLLIDDNMIVKFKEAKNVIPVISLEGYENYTDVRRGKGVYQKAREVMKKLGENNIFYGTSLTVTSQNFDTIMSKDFVNDIASIKCKIFFYVEYIPVKEGTESLIPTGKQRKDIICLMNSLRARYSGLFIAFPGDEEKYGGCMSSGRGFVHVGPDGSVEPCPFAPYSDTNLAGVSLKDALQSDFLRTIRENHDQLIETRGGCALWEKKEWVRSLLSKDSDTKLL